MSLYTTLSIGRGALQVAQLGMQVTAQNIANVNTEGYKRQRMEQANMPFGLGVTVRTISRLQSTFAEKQLLGVVSEASRTNSNAQAYNSLEALFDEISGRSLDPEFKEFFRALQDLSARPGGAAERATLRSQGDSIAHAFNYLSQQMNLQIKDQEAGLQNIVTQANDLLRTIADLNKRLGGTAQGDLTANALRTERDVAVRRLSELMPVSVLDDGAGNFAVYIQNGMPLVSNAEAYQLSLEPDVTNELKSQIIWSSPDGTRHNVTSQMTSGSMGGILKNRDVIIPEQMQKLDRIAAEFVRIFNEQHRQGMGLDGVTNRNFFEPTPVYAGIGQGSRGGAAISGAVVTNPSALTRDEYEIRFADSGGGLTYTLLNRTTGSMLDSGAYVSGMSLSFDGISLTVGDATGAPMDGDFFRINTVTGAAAHIRLSSDILNSLDAIAAGMTSATGDNQNALLLAGLENSRVAAGGTMSFSEMYQAMLVELGVAASTQSLEQETQATLLSQTQNMVESVGGVNIDEEATSLMQYQHAYQAAAKIITTVDEMLKTLVNMI